MTAFAIIIACIAFMLVAGVARGNPGRGIADTTILVMLLALVTLVGLVLGQFMDTGDAAKFVAIVFAVGFAVDSLYGLMAPERQKRRDRRLRRLMKRRA
jgi:hypothetical protein